jgi:bacillopeptidase F
MTQSRLSEVYRNGAMTKTRGSSRLVKREEKKLGKQAFVFIFFGLLILALFIFVLVPIIVRFFFAILDKESPLESKDDIPPQTPILSSIPPEATYSAQLNLSGYAEAKSQVVFILNDQEDAQVDVAEDGQFQYTVDLQPGSNNLAFYGKDAAGNESLKTVTYNIVRDTDAPNIEIEQPLDGTTIELKKNRSTEIKGKTEIGSKLTLNGRTVLVDSDGNFSTSYYLDEGKNELNFQATDKAGNHSEKMISVEFRL